MQQKMREKIIYDFNGPRMFNVCQLAVAINMIEKLMLTQWKELTRLPSVILTDEMDIYHTQCHSYVVAIVSRQKPNKVHARVTVVSFFSSFFRQRSIKSEHLALFFSERKKNYVYLIINCL